MTIKNYLILHGGKIISEHGVLENSAVIINNNVIEAIVPSSSVKDFSSKKILDFPSNFHIVPGFIDMHIHGANGKDVMDGDFAALATISEALLAEGTTSYLATTMTAKPDEIEHVLMQVRDYVSEKNKVVGAQIIGVHLEGPFLSPKKVGAQRSDLILNPEIKLVEHWQKMSNQLIKLVTLAPELPGSVELIKYLKQQNIIASIGHTDATFVETMSAINAGCHHATHLFNAMRGIHQREPGAVTAALLSEKVMAELIVDGVHLHPAIVQLALKLKGIEKLVLVTDAMRAKCLRDGVYDLGGQSVDVKNGVASLVDGTLAGSTLKMSDAVNNMLQFTECRLSDVVKMVSENPAKSLGIFNKKGSIAVNKDADLVVLDEKLKIVMTVCGGKII